MSDFNELTPEHVYEIRNGHIAAVEVINAMLAFIVAPKDTIIEDDAANALRTVVDSVLEDHMLASDTMRAITSCLVATAPMDEVQAYFAHIAARSDQELERLEGE